MKSNFCPLGAWLKGQQKSGLEIKCDLSLAKAQNFCYRSLNQSSLICDDDGWQRIWGEIQNRGKLVLSDLRAWISPSAVELARLGTGLHYDLSAPKPNFLLLTKLQSYAKSRPNFESVDIGNLARRTIFIHERAMSFGFVIFSVWPTQEKMNRPTLPKSSVNQNLGRFGPAGRLGTIFRLEQLSAEADRYELDTCGPCCKKVHEEEIGAKRKGGNVFFFKEKQWQVEQPQLHNSNSVRFQSRHVWVLPTFLPSEICILIRRKCS